MARHCAASTSARLPFERFFLLAVSLIVPAHLHAQTCNAPGQQYFGRCITVTPPSPTLRAFLEEYGQPLGKVGELADLFAPDVPLFDKPEPGRKIIHAWRRPNADIESEARIDGVLPDFYMVTLSIYEGPTSCGIEEFKQKGPKTTLRGYVPKTSPQGLPSLWKFKHLSGLC